jgi:hypothetical protein
LFHGLPSDRVRAIAQTNDGALWFGTEAGLAKFDGRRTQTINDPQLPAGRVLALQTDQEGTLWVGTEAGASRLTGNGFEAIKETAGKTISSIIAPEARRVLMGTEQGQVYETRVMLVATVTVTGGFSSGERQQSTGSKEVLDTRALLNQPLESADRERPGPLPITSLSWANNRLLAGTLSRGVVQIEDGVGKDVQMRPLVYFVNALERDINGNLWVGARSRKEEPGALAGKEPSELTRGEDPTEPPSSTAATGSAPLQSSCSTPTAVRSTKNSSAWVITRSATN